jgi:hypothetical protein
MYSRPSNTCVTSSRVATRRSRIVSLQTHAPTRSHARALTHAHASQQHVRSLAARRDRPLFVRVRASASASVCVCGLSCMRPHHELREPNPENGDEAQRRPHTHAHSCTHARTWTRAHTHTPTLRSSTHTHASDRRSIVSSLCGARRVKRASTYIYIHSARTRTTHGRTLARTCAHTISIR